MKQVVIINASGFGREIYWVVQNTAAYGVDYVFKGFLDDRIDMLTLYRYPFPILDSVENYQPTEDDVFVCAISNPADKLKYASMIKEKGGKFINIIDRTVLFSTSNVLGEGVIIANSCALSCDVTIGDFVTMNAFSVVGHDVVIGDYAHVNSFSAINGGAKIGPFATLHSHAVILPNMQVGKGAVVGAGSVVLKNVPEHTTVFGVPAVTVRA